MTISVAQQLAAVPPRRFVEERDRLAGAMARAGDKAGAAETRKLRKPSRAVWVLAQLARDAPERCAELFAASDALIEVQQSARGDLAPWRAALARQRDRFESLVTHARHLLEAAGEAPDDATMERVARGLRAAAAGGPARKDLLEGTPSEDPPEPGFAFLAPSVSGPAEGPLGDRASREVRPSSKPDSAPGAAIPRREDAGRRKQEAALEAAKKSAARTAEEVVAANRAWELARDAESAARALREDAEKDVERARRALGEAEAVLQERARAHAGRKRELAQRTAARSRAHELAAHAEEVRAKAAAALGARRPDG